MNATINASLSWLCDFVHSAKDDYKEPREGEPPQREDDCLTTQGVIDELVERALTAIRTSSDDGSLIYHQDLISILYAWRSFQGNDPTEPKAWTDSMLERDEALVIFAKAFTGESWSHGIGGFGFLADNVATRTIRAKIDENTDIIDQVRFKEGLEALLRKNVLSDQDKVIVDSFMNAWNNPEED